MNIKLNVQYQDTEQSLLKEKDFEQISRSD